MHCLSTLWVIHLFSCGLLEFCELDTWTTPCLCAQRRLWKAWPSCSHSSLSGCSSCPPLLPPSRHTNEQKTTRRACGEETGILSPPFSSTSPTNPRQWLIYTLVIFCDTAEEEVGYLFCPLQLHEAGLWSPYHSYVPHTRHSCISLSPTCSSAGPWAPVTGSVYDFPQLYPSDLTCCLAWKNKAQNRFSRKWESSAGTQESLRKFRETVKQGQTHLFLKLHGKSGQTFPDRPASQWFRLWWATWSLTRGLCCCFLRAATDNMQMSVPGHVPRQLYL